MTCLSSGQPARVTPADSKPGRESGVWTSSPLEFGGNVVGAPFVPLGDVAFFAAGGLGEEAS